MKLTFLGSSHGVPEKTRKCTSLLLSVGDKCYIIDAGVMLVSELTRMGIDLNTIRAVFITHMHGDHTNGLIEFVDLLDWYYKDVRPEIFVPQIAARDAVAAWLNVNGEPGKDRTSTMPPMKEVVPGLFYEDDRIRISARDNTHLKGRPSYSYTIEAEGKKLLLTGDMGGEDYADLDLVASEGGYDLVVTEAAHCHLSRCAERFRRIDMKRLIISHIVPWNEPEAEQLAGELACPVRVAEDGWTTEI